jgi:hypothetical protein
MKEMGNEKTERAKSPKVRVVNKTKRGADSEHEGRKKGAAE